MEYLTAAQVQQALHISPSTYYRWLDEGRIETDKIEGKQTRLFLAHKIRNMPEYHVDRDGNRTVTVALWQPGRVYQRNGKRIRNIRLLHDRYGPKDYFEVTYTDGSSEELYKNCRITEVS